MRLMVDSLNHEFGTGCRLYDGLKCSLMPGDVTALVGPSGSGKTTLLMILAGWLTPTSGNIVREDISRLSWVAQNPHGDPERTALDHVVLPLLAAGGRRAPAEGQGRALLADFGLSATADRRFRHLSGGEASRLMLACAVACAPDLLLVDEPTAQLDRKNALMVSEVIQRLASPGRIVVVATHDDRVQSRCSRSIDLGAET